MISLLRLAAAAWLMAALPAAAADRPALRGDVVASGDTLTLGDLVSDAPPALAGTPLFRAPALGQSGTIQARRIAAAAEALGLETPETGGRLQVSVTRAARRVGGPEIEAALRKALAREIAANPATTGIAFDGPAPLLLLAPDVVGEPVATEIAFDRRSRRVSATIFVGPSPSERRGQVRVSGQVVDYVEVAILGRALERGEVVKAADLTVERRPRESVSADAAHDGAPMDGRVARRALPAGSMLRSADLVRPELVARGQIVTVVYEIPGVSLSMRARANEGGAQGDGVTLVNLQSKKTIEGVVVGPGRVSVSAAIPGRIASAQP